MKYQIVDCSRKCSLNPERLPAGVGELIHRWFEEGANRDAIMSRAMELGVKLSSGAVGRHKSNHLRVARDDNSPLPPEDGQPGRRYTELETIDAIIQRGAQGMQLSSAKVTTEQLLSAIALKHKLTEGSVFDALFEMLSGDDDEDLSDLEIHDEDEGGR